MPDISRATYDDSATARMTAARQSRNRLARERNQWLSVFTRHLPKGWSAHLAPAQTEPKEGGWNFVVCLHSPVGQIATRIAPDDLDLFDHLKETASDWDRHTYSDKLDRLGQLCKTPIRKHRRKA